MKFSAHPDIILLLKTLRLGTITADVCCKPSSEQLLNLIMHTVKEVGKKYELSEINKQEVIASTRNAYKKCKNDPNRYRPSADALIRRIVKGSSVYFINNVNAAFMH